MLLCITNNSTSPSVCQFSSTLSRQRTITSVPTGMEAAPENMICVRQSERVNGIAKLDIQHPN